MGIIRFKNQTEPSTPPSGRSEMWIDSTTKQLKTKDDSGLVSSYESTGYTSENVANKENVTVDSSTTKYPTVNLLKNHVDNKRKIMSSGTVTDILISDLGLGQITISSCDVALYDNPTFNGNIETYTVPAITGHQLIPNQYTYITINYNSGSPTYNFILDNTLINHSNIITAAQVYWEYTGSLNSIHIFKPGEDGLGLSNKLAHQLIHTDRFAFESGLAISEYGTRNILITSGKVWYSGEEINTLPVDSVINQSRLYYHTSGNFTGTLVSQYNNTQYDNGTDLVTLSDGKYAVNWIYKSVNNTSPDTYILLGSGNYSLSDAQLSQQPTLPLIVAKQTILVGRIIVLKGSNTATEITSAFTQVFAGSAPADHSNLTHLDYVGSGHTGFQQALGFTPENTTNKENTTVDTSTFKYPTINLLNTYVNTQRKLLACGPTSNIVVTDLGAGSISVSSCTANFNTADDFSGTINTYTVPAIASFTLTANQYYYIVPNYNAGSPIYTFTTDNTIINHSTKLNGVQVYWEVIGAINQIHIFSSGTYGLGLSNKLSHRLIHTERFGYESGLALSEYGTRNLSLTSGTLWYDGEQVSTLAVLSVASPIHLYYHISSSWFAISNPQYNNTQYDNGVDLVTLTNGRYAVNWIYRSVNGTDTTLFNVLGSGDYTLLQAQSSQQPSLPNIIQKQAILVGRIIIQKNASVATQIDSAFSTSFSSQQVIDHANLSNLDYASSGHTGFQASLGFTPENVTNKENTTLDTSVTKYPTNNLVKTYVDNAISVSSPWITSGSNIYRLIGNIGIGTATPTYPMMIKDLTLANTYTSLAWVDNASALMGHFGKDYYGGYLSIVNGATEHVRLTGNNQSYCKVNVTTTSNKGAGVTGLNNGAIGIKTSNVIGEENGIFFNNISSGNTGAGITAYTGPTVGAWNQQGLKFSTNSTGTLENRMIITYDGKVGIGNTTPASPLQVTGETRSTDLVLAKTISHGIKVDETAPTFGWRDMIGPVTAKNTGPTAPSFNLFMTNIYQYQFTVGDEIWVDFHVPHDYVPGTDLFIHAHWAHISPAVTTGGVTWGFDITYAKGHNQAAFPATKNLQVTQAASTIQNQHMIAEIQMTVTGGDATRTDTSLIEPDGLIFVRAYLAGNTMNGTPEPFLKFVDVHYQSNCISTKNKVPNFYA